MAAFDNPGAASQGMWAPLAENQREKRARGCSNRTEESTRRGQILLHVNYSSVNPTSKKASDPPPPPGFLGSLTPRDESGESGESGVGSQPNTSSPPCSRQPGGFLSPFCSQPCSHLMHLGLKPPGQGLAASPALPQPQSGKDVAQEGTDMTAVHHPRKGACLCPGNHSAHSLPRNTRCQSASARDPAVPLQVPTRSFQEAVLTHL